MTLANKITLARFLFSLVGFATAWFWQNQALLVVSYVIFLAVAFSDALDGWAARRYGEITEIGRIADPMVDKISVCGVLILTQRIPVIEQLVPAWIIVVIVVREFVVSGIRAAAEAKGIPFPANIWGKVKAFLQMVLAGATLMYPAHQATQAAAWCRWFVVISGWAAAAATVVSGAIYAREAVKVLKSK
jgi:CDP-diacylglycerol--glycerol-3-phosphate 3-phosphatidyltransferase